MDANRFDAIAKSLIAGTNRRRTLGGLLGGALGALGLPGADDDAEAKSGKCDPKCDECNECQKGKCKKKNGKKTCKPGKCKPKDNGTSCAALSNGATCQKGICICPGGLTSCSGDCVDTQTDKNHCGICDAVCPANQVCQNGACSCPPGTELCNGSCLALCPAGISTRNPETCGCCRVNGLLAFPCNSPFPCCSGNCFVPNPMVPNQTICVGRADNEDCQFDAQCDSGDCDAAGECSA